MTLNKHKIYIIMIDKIIIVVFLLSFILMSCEEEEELQTTTSAIESEIIIPKIGLESGLHNPKKLLKEAYQQFKEGNDEASIATANKVFANWTRDKQRHTNWRCIIIFMQKCTANIRHYEIR